MTYPRTDGSAAQGPGIIEVAPIQVELAPTDIIRADGTMIDPAEHRSNLLRLAVRLSIYYAVFGTIFVLSALYVPWLADYLPLGGLGERAGLGKEISEFGAVLERGGKGLLPDGSALAPGAPKGWLQEAARLFLAMLSTFALMLPVSWVYKSIHEGDEFDHSIDETILILPAIFAGIITVVQHSLTLAFALAGIMAGVRFRRALSDTSDTLFIFMAIGVGLAAGASAIEIAIVLTVFFNFLMVGVCVFGDGLESKYQARKRSAKMVEKGRKMAVETAKAQTKAQGKARLKASEDRGVDDVTTAPMP